MVAARVTARVIPATAGPKGAARPSGLLLCPVLTAFRILSSPVSHWEVVPGQDGVFPTGPGRHGLMVKWAPRKANFGGPPCWKAPLWHPRPISPAGSVAHVHRRHEPITGPRGRPRPGWQACRTGVMVEGFLGTKARWSSVAGRSRDDDQVPASPRRATATGRPCGDVTPAGSRRRRGRGLRSCAAGVSAPTTTGSPPVAVTSVSRRRERKVRGPAPGRLASSGTRSKATLPGSTPASTSTVLVSPVVAVQCATSVSECPSRPARHPCLRWSRAWCVRQPGARMPALTSAARHRVSGRRRRGGSGMPARHYARTPGISGLRVDAGRPGAGPLPAADEELVGGRIERL